MERLDRHADTMALTVAVEQGDLLAAGLIAQKVRARHPPGFWKERRFWWRNHVHAMLALAVQCLEQIRNRRRSSSRTPRIVAGSWERAFCCCGYCVRTHHCSIAWGVAESHWTSWPRRLPSPGRKG